MHSASSVVNYCTKSQSRRRSTLYRINRTYRDVTLGASQLNVLFSTSYVAELLAPSLNRQNRFSEVEGLLQDPAQLTIIPVTLC